MIGGGDDDTVLLNPLISYRSEQYPAKIVVFEQLEDNKERGNWIHWSVSWYENYSLGDER